MILPTEKNARETPAVTMRLSIGSVCLATTLALLIVSGAGCRGCIRTDGERLSREELEKRAREQKEAIVTTQLQSMPADSEIKTVAAKPGHWIETSRRVRSNREDLQVVAAGDVIRGTETILKIPGTNVSTQFARPTVLPKGQWKSIDLQYFIPTTSISVDPLKPTPTGLRLRSSLLSRSLLTPILQEQFPVNELRFSEFILAIVSPKPQDYSFMTSTDLTLWRNNDMMQEDVPRSYTMVQCGSEDGKMAFPTSMMTMTAMAVVLWDDLAPDDLSEDQKTALVDWLHWGGQLVISGPGSWSRLQNSFLTDYLPVAAAEPAELGTEELAPLNYWVVADKTGGSQDRLVIDGAKVPGLTMKLNSDGQWLPQTGALVAERCVGRGRVVITGFPLREQRLYRWKYFSNFFSSGILRRPARDIKKSVTDQSVSQVWAAGLQGQERNPLLNSQLRIASRDMPLSSTTGEAEEFARRGQEELNRRFNARSINELDAEPGRKPSLPVRYDNSSNESLQWAPNGAAWSDTSGFAFSALSALRNAAGIVLPDRWTILMLIGGYLAILVPINWLVFRLLGRLELAWVAVPILALAGVLVVTRVARLDIGFARRTTEISLLEMHGEYPRGHLTSYAALYTSLSTNYTLDYPESGSVALPLGEVAARDRRSANSSSTIQVKYGSNPGIQLEPVTVFSNSTEMLHAEQMLAFPGGILYGTKSETPNEVAIKNTTGLQLKSCCLIREDEEGKFQFAWVGDLSDDKSVAVTFEYADRAEPWKFWNRALATRYVPPRVNGDDAADGDNIESPTGNAGETMDEDASQLAVGGVLHELLSSVPLVDGQVRLLAYTDDRLSKMESKQADGQLDSRSVVMVHLQSAKLGDVSRDEAILGRIPTLVDATENVPLPNEE